MHHQCHQQHHHHQLHHRQPGQPGTARLRACPGRVATPSPPRCALDPSGQPPALPQEQHGEQWHGHMRTDEYHWLTQLQPTHPTVLQHLQAEGAYTISALAHTRDLQLQLQARLGDWLLAAALQEAQQEDGNTTQQPQQQTVAPDWMGGQGSLCYQQRSSFGWPGTRVAGHHFFSLPAYPTARIAPAAATAAPAAGAPPLLHFRAPGDACSAWQEQQEQGRAAGSSDGAAAPGGRPPGSVLCWSEAAEQQLQHSARTARASNTHSLEASPDGRFLAVTHKPVGGSSDGAFTLSIIDCSTGCQVGASTEGVDGPIQWVQRQQQTSTQQQASRQPQHLLFVAADQLEVHCLSLLPAVDAAAAAAAATHQQCVFKDPQRVSVSLAAAGTLDCIVVHAADGLPRQLLFYSGCAGASSSSRQWLWPDNPAAWHELLPLAAVTPCSSSGSGDDGGGAVSSDASVRLIASVAGSWLLARCSSAAAPQGCLHAAHMPAAAGPVSRVHLQPVPLPDHQEQQPQQRAVAWLMEAVFPVSSQQAGGDLQVLVLRSSWQLVGTSPQQPLQPMRHVVHADWYHVLAFQGQQQQQQLPGASSSGSLQAQHAGGCVLPLPVPFFQLAGGAWQPQEGQLALTFSSLLVPLSRLSVDLQQLEAAHAGRQPQQALADGQHAQVQLQQAVPPGFDATAYAAAQLAVPSSADSGVRIPVSLAWHRHRVQRAVLQQLAGDDVTAGAAASDSTSNATPMLLSCYGSYAVKEAAGFEAELLQLLDDGWVVGIAHVRGGGWLGPAWAEAGRCCGKRTSIRDLTDVLEYVQQAGVCSPGHLFVQAASAGAWLAASAVLQACAGLVQGVVLSVPCCDPLGLMLHQQQGRLELGDAVADAQVYHSVRGWAPYDVLGQRLQAMQADRSAQPSGAQEDNSSSGSSDSNAPVPPARLPHFLIRAALLDDDVPLHDPVRTAARLRRLQQLPQAVAERAAAATATAAATWEPRVLLRVVPGGHTAFSSGDVREAALKLAFLMTLARGGLQS